MTTVRTALGQITINAKKVVIVGAGPAGLIATLAWHRAGITDITLVDSWAGEFYRSHEITEYVFKKLCDYMLPFALSSHSIERMQLKDIEKQLFAHVEQLKIRVIKKKFAYFAPHRTLILMEKEGDASKKIELKNVDMVVDCTGESRAVIKNYNEQQKNNSQKKKFVIEPLNQDPPMLYGKMRIIADDKTIDNFNFDKGMYDPSAYVKNMEALHKLGWSQCVPPQIHSMPRPKKNSTLTKGHLYMELPRQFYTEEKSKLDEDYLLEYATYLFRLSNDDKEQKLTLELQKTKQFKKKMLAIFKVNVKKTTPAFLLGDCDYPFIMHLGDSSYNLPFFTGSGLLKGIYQIRYVLESCFEIKNNTIESINAEQWELDYQANLVSGSERIIESKKIINEAKAWTEEKALQLYRDAYLETEDENEQAMIAARFERFTSKKEMDKLRRLHINQLLAKVFTKPIVEEEMDVLGIEKNATYLKKLTAHFSFLSPVEKKEVQDKWHYLAMSYKNLGNFCVKHKKMYSAIVAYEKAITVYAEQANAFYDERIFLYSNLIIALFKKQDYKKIITLAKEAEELFPHLDKSSTKIKIVMRKIAYHKVKATFCEIVKMQAAQVDPEMTHILLQEIEKTFLELPSHQKAWFSEYGAIRMPVSEPACVMPAKAGI